MGLTLRCRLSPILTLIFLVFAISFSFIATFDCHFVSIKPKVIGPSLSKLQNLRNSRHLESTSQGIGFFAWEGSNGKCDVEESSDSFLSYHMYQEFLGPDWYIPQIMASASIVLSSISAMWTVLYYCVLPIRAVQCSLALMFVIVLPIIQLVPLLIFHSNFCDNFMCIVGPSAQYAICATLLYIMVGFSMIPRMTLCVNDAKQPSTNVE